MQLDPTRVVVMKLIQRSGSDLKKASLAIGRNAAYLHQYLYRGTPKTLPGDAREALAVHLGVPDEDLRDPETRRAAAPVASHPSHGQAGMAAVQRERVAIAGYVPIPELDVRASAGPGALHDGLEEGRETWLFPDAVIRHEFRARAADLRVITIDGDSMEPLLSSGDRILVDTSQRVPAPPGVFVVWDGIGVVAKRVEHIPNSEPARIIIRSINPEYQTYERTAEEVRIVGRVIWMARRL